MPEDMSEDMPDRMPEDLPDRMPEHMPEDMPDRMPNRMSEDMSDRMPEDLPVRKCINVMVGITRSKVCFLARASKGFAQNETTCISQGNCCITEVSTSWGERGHIFCRHPSTWDIVPH